MALIVVNPTPRAGNRAGAKHRPKAATKKGEPMAKRRRSAAQKAAFKKMIAARRHHNPGTKRRRSVRRYSAPVRRRRIHRNPSTGGSGIFGELMSKDGLMMIAAVVGTPTLVEIAAGYLMPTATGITRTAIKGAIGLGLGYAVYRFVNKKAGMVVALVAAGSAISEVINQYMAPGTSVLPGSSAAAAPRVVNGYLAPKRPALAGYATREPGLYRL
jgi:hypothetical protein